MTIKVYDKGEEVEIDDLTDIGRDEAIYQAQRLIADIEELNVIAEPLEIA